MEISFTCSRPNTGDLSDFIHEMHVPVANRMAIWMALLLLAMGLENYASPFASSSFIAREYRERLIKSS